MAHSHAVETNESRREGFIVRRSYRHGRESERRIESDELADALQLAQGAIRETLAELLRRCLELRGTDVAAPDE